MSYQANAMPIDWKKVRERHELKSKSGITLAELICETEHVVSYDEVAPKPGSTGWTNIDPKNQQGLSAGADKRFDYEAKHVECRLQNYIDGRNLSQETLISANNQFGNVNARFESMASVGAPSSSDLRSLLGEIQTAHGGVLQTMMSGSEGTRPKLAELVHPEFRALPTISMPVRGPVQPVVAPKASSSSGPSTSGSFTLPQVPIPRIYPVQQFNPGLSPVQEAINHTARSFAHSLANPFPLADAMHARGRAHNERVLARFDAECAQTAAYAKSCPSVFRRLAHEAVVNDIESKAIAAHTEALYSSIEAYLAASSAVHSDSHENPCGSNELSCLKRHFDTYFASDGELVTNLYAFISKLDQTRTQMREDGSYELLDELESHLRGQYLDDQGLLRPSYLNGRVVPYSLRSDISGPEGAWVRKELNKALLARSWFEQNLTNNEQLRVEMVEWFDTFESFHIAVDLSGDAQAPIQEYINALDVLQSSRNKIEVVGDFLRGFITGFKNESKHMVVGTAELIKALPGFVEKLPDLKDELYQLLSNLPETAQRVSNYAYGQWERVLSANPEELGEMVGGVTANITLPVAITRGTGLAARTLKRAVKHQVMSKSLAHGLESSLSNIPSQNAAAIKTWTQSAPELAYLQSKQAENVSHLAEAFHQSDRIFVPQDLNVQRVLGKLTEQARESTLKELASSPTQLRALVESVNSLGIEGTERLIHIVGKPHAVELLQSNVKDLKFYSPISERPALTRKLTGSISPFKSEGETFRGGSYVSYETTKKMELYRVVGSQTEPDKYHIGRYWSRMEASGSVQATADLALEKLWKNNAGILIKIEIPAGFKLFEGSVAGLPSDGAGNISRFLGGGNQVFLSKNMSTTHEMVRKVVKF